MDTKQQGNIHSINNCVFTIRSHNISPNNFNGTVHITLVTTATCILEINGVTFLTDPIFGNAPAEYEITHLVPGAPHRMFAEVEEGPAFSLSQLPVIDAILLSHEYHIDKLDNEGRRLLDRHRVVTTQDGAKNLGLRPGVAAIDRWETPKYNFNGVEWEITGTPCTHLPGVQVTGFILLTEEFGTSSEGQPNAIHSTGNTVLMPSLVDIRDRFHIAVAVMNLGDARFPLPGHDEPLQITMGGKEGVKLFHELGADVPVPIHYES